MPDPEPRRLKVGRTAPSSTRKKVVKEGSRKFIGPRQLSSELAENYESALREGGPKVLAKDFIVRGRKKVRGGRQFYDKSVASPELSSKLDELAQRLLQMRFDLEDAVGRGEGRKDLYEEQRPLFDFLRAKGRI